MAYFACQSYSASVRLQDYRLIHWVAADHDVCIMSSNQCLLMHWIRNTAFASHQLCLGRRRHHRTMILHTTYSISQEICTRFCCALLCCGYAIVHNEFTWSFIHIHQGCFAGTGAIVRLPQYQWSKPDGYGKISQCITTTKHSKAKTTFLGIYCTSDSSQIRAGIIKFAPNINTGVLLAGVENSDHWPWPSSSFWPLWLRILGSLAFPCYTAL